MFFDKTCIITSISETYDTNGELTESTNSVYTSIACDFYKQGSNKYTNDKFVTEGRHYDYTVVLEGDKTSVRIGQIIELIDIVSYGKFIIDDILVFRNINGIIDNFELKVSQKKK